MADVTTIKVSKALRERIAADAADLRMTAQAFLETVLDGYERNSRLASVADAYRQSSAAELDHWREETHQWDATNTDGLDA